MRTSLAPAFLALLGVAGCPPKGDPSILAALEEVVPAEPPTQRGDTVDVLHGVEVADPYRWLEDGASEEVAAWEVAWNARSEHILDRLPQAAWLEGRFQHLWRYNDESVPSPCLLSDKYLIWTKKADEDKWVVNLRDGAEGELRTLIDPNTWESTQTLAEFTASPDCSLAVFGTARAGDENPVLRVIDLATLEVRDDAVRGWKQGGVAWKHDNSGFFYTSRPTAGEVPEGEEHYWHRALYHPLGTDGSKDTVVMSHPDTKEYFHWVSVEEGGRYSVRYRSTFDETEAWLHDLKAGDEGRPLVTGLDAEYGFTVVDRNTIFVATNWDAPRRRVMVTTVDKPGRKHWKELIPQTDDVLDDVAAVGGHLYLVYQDDVKTRIDVYDPTGKKLGEVPLPTAGSAKVSGNWSKPEVWVSFSSYATPPTTYAYDVAKNALTLVKESPIDIDASNIVADQVWYESADGTRVPMFLVHDRDAPRDGSVPYLLNAYGGFDISIRPRFSTSFAVWIEAGGGVAIPNLRGGGEFGKAWHEAGMREKKQNVFDDFTAAAEYLVKEGYSDAKRLAIQGGSNGGLLVSAATVQHPELYAAVHCAVPLTDMVRFHKFGLANIWAEEYGSADDPEMFPHLLKYSPYHNVKVGTKFPAVLVTGSENDARTSPLHARKWFAAIDHADPDNADLLLLIQRDSGHGGGVTIDTRARQTARTLGFLMNHVGLEAPELHAGKVVTFTDSQWKVVKAEDLGSTLTAGEHTATTEGRFVHVWFEVKNTTDADVIVYEPAKLWLGGDVELYDYDLQTEFLDGDAATLAMETLPAGEWRAFQAIYEVPPDAAEVTFQARSLDPAAPQAQPVELGL